MNNQIFFNSYFGLPPLWRLALYVAVLTALVVFGLRWIERVITYHPQLYTGGVAWHLPANSEEVWFGDQQQGLRYGWLVQTTQPVVRATVLHCHGNGGNLTNVRWFAEALAARGFDVLIWDYRGYGRSGGELTDEWGLYADGAAAYEWLVKTRGVKPERLILYGQSLGSTVAIDLAAQKPAAALIVESGLSSASEMAAVALPWLPRWLHWLGKNRFESSRKLTTIKMPVFIAHGTSDEVIPFAHSQTNYVAAPEPKELMVIEGGTHNLFGEHHTRMIERMAAFLAQHTNLK